jgi:hypothetical protein
MEIRLDRLLGRLVRAQNNRTVGRLEEFRAEVRGDSWLITEYVIGTVGLLERLHVGVALLFGSKRGGYVARWDQLDVSDPEQPRLLCSPAELREIR